MMKNLLAILSITLVSYTVTAESAVVEFGSSLAPIKSESKQNDSNLWNMLDTDKDGYITKSEAVYSTYLSDRWATLDTNKDEKLDTAEFSQFYSKKNKQ
jgi:Ca2+-binding EF-hand superfamily protein